MNNLFKFILINSLTIILSCDVSFPSTNERRRCRHSSITTASGSQISKSRFCPGELIFKDEFNEFDLKKWQHENTLAGGGNWEFQWYTNNRSNSFVEDGHLHIRPTLTSEDENYLKSGTISLSGGAPADQCTNAAFYGCERVGSATHILNPVKSARVRTVESFNFKYGKIEVKAKLPSGDWLWPAIWMLPARNAYGGWPTSGEIDIVESRGNENLMLNGKNIGTELVMSTLHFGPDPNNNAYPTAHYEKNSSPGEGFDKDFHIYELEWTPTFLKFFVDGEKLGTVNVDQGFWKRGNFSDNLENPWKYNSLAAPFDQEFYIVINLAVGGVSFFPDNAINPNKKPWLNNSPHAATDFWNGRDSWIPSWDLNEKTNSKSIFKIDYVKVYASSLENRDC